MSLIVLLDCYIAAIIYVATLGLEWLLRQAVISRVCSGRSSWYIKEGYTPSEGEALIFIFLYGIGTLWYVSAVVRCKYIRVFFLWGMLIWFSVEWAITYHAKGDVSRLPMNDIMGCTNWAKI